MSSDSRSPKLFWIHGLAGIGKSTIAQSLAESLPEGQLGASYFFSSQDVDRNTTRALFPTIAYQLCIGRSKLQDGVREVLLKDRSILTKRYFA